MAASGVFSVVAGTRLGCLEHVVSMPRLDQHALYEFDILRHVEHTSRLNNRLASQKLGVSIKLAHEILKSMVKKGLLHVKVIHSRRWDYFLTPKGIREKTRLTLEFLEFSMHFYREARRQSAQLCRTLASEGKFQVAFLGSGDLAEITYLGVKEWGLGLAAVYDDERAGKRLMGMPVRAVADLPLDTSDVVIVCMYDSQMPMRENYLPPDVCRTERMRWVFDARVQE